MNLAACASVRLEPLQAAWYRAIPLEHWQTALQTVHTKKGFGRFHYGSRRKPGVEVLYLGEDHEVALREFRALFGSPFDPNAAISNPKTTPVILNVRVQLDYVADLTRPEEQELLGTSAQELTGDWLGYLNRGPSSSIPAPRGPAPTQVLGAALFQVPLLEGFQTVSAQFPTRRSLVVFPEKVRASRRSGVEFSYPPLNLREYIGP